MASADTRSLRRWYWLGFAGLAPATAGPERARRDGVQEAEEGQDGEDDDADENRRVARTGRCTGLGVYRMVEGREEEPQDRAHPHPDEKEHNDEHHAPPLVACDLAVHVPNSTTSEVFRLQVGRPDLEPVPGASATVPITQATVPITSDSPSPPRPTPAYPLPRCGVLAAGRGHAESSTPAARSPGTRPRTGYRRGATAAEAGAPRRAVTAEHGTRWCRRPSPPSFERVDVGGCPPARSRRKATAGHDVGADANDPLTWFDDLGMGHVSVGTFWPSSMARPRTRTLQVLDCAPSTPPA